MPVSVGIDLGTTFSAVAVMDKRTNQPVIVPNSEDKKITPSIIQFLDGQMIFGSEAESAYNAGREDCVGTFKRNMGSHDPYCYIDGIPYTSEDLSSFLLKHLKEDAEAQLGDTISEAVITVPAYFFSTEREATINAAKRAGLNVKRIIDEPNAAIMAYGLKNWRENANIMVYDLGGGTFDVTLSHMGKNGQLETIVTRGNHILGGRDWDDRLADIIIKKFEDETGMDLSDDSHFVATVRGLAEGVKKELSKKQAVQVPVGYAPGRVQSVTVTLNEFNRATSDLLESTGILCDAVLQEAGLRWKNVTDILLVGGSTRMRQVPEYLEKLYGKKPISHVNPDEAVALGAAIQASKESVAYATLSVATTNGVKKTDRSALQNQMFLSVKPAKDLGSAAFLSLRETTAHAMGVVSINDDTNRYYNEIIIPANHPRPVRAAKRFRFYTSPTSANELTLYVLQGDSPNPLDCQIPYKYIVSGIKHVTRGEQYGTVIRIQYSYDENGIIRVQARQGDETADLPIRRDDASTDISVFGRPVSKDSSVMGGNFMKTTGPGVDHEKIVHQYKAITFSNAEWVPYDRLLHHEDGSQFNEPKVHVAASETNIEFHGYNISAMNEGVTYTIHGTNDFEIDCDINTSTIQPHPGGHLEISLGIIQAQLTQDGGDIYLAGQNIARVGSQFNIRMSLTDNGHYRVYIDRKLAGEQYSPNDGYIDVRFGFVHDSHYCSLLSHAYVSNITMMQRNNDDDSSETETWDD